MKKYLIFGLLCAQIFQISAQNLRKMRVNFKESAYLNSSDSLFYLAGDFNNWNPHDPHYEFKRQAGNSWYLELSIPIGQHEFKLTKGDWSNVESAKDQTSISNRTIDISKDTSIYLLVANFQHASLKRPIESKGSVNVSRVISKVLMPYLSLDRKLWIYFPPSYHKLNKRYPMIYIQDGQNLFDIKTSGYGEWGVDAVLDSLSKTYKGEYMVIGIDHSGSTRITEYNPFDSKFGKGTGDNYVDFIVNTLKPFIDKKYRTLGESKSTTIAGSSMGGLISMYAIVKYPEVFGNAGIFSPSFWILPDIYNFVNHHKFKKSKIYFVAGLHESEDMVNDMWKIVQILLHNGVLQKNLKLFIKEDGIHSEWFWHQEFPDFIDWLENH